MFYGRKMKYLSILLLLFLGTPIFAQDEFVARSPGAYLSVDPPPDASSIAYTYVQVATEGGRARSVYTPVVRRTFDRSGRLSREDWYADLPPAEYRFSYQASSGGLLTRITADYGAGVLAPYLPARIEIERSSGRPTAVLGRSSSGATLFSRTLRYDGRGNVVEETFSQGRTAEAELVRTYSGGVVGGLTVTDDRGREVYREDYSTSRGGRPLREPNLAVSSAQRTSPSVRDGRLDLGYGIEGDFSVRVAGEHPRNAADLIVDRVTQVADRLELDPDDERVTEAEIINFSAFAVPLESSFVTYRSLQTAVSIAEESLGHYSPLVLGHLGRIGTDSILRPAGIRGHQDQLLLHDGGFRVGLLLPGARLETLPFIRGAAVDEARRALVSMRLGSAAVTVDGVSYFAGLRDEFTPYTVTVPPPQSEGAFGDLYEVDVVNAAVASAYAPGLGFISGRSTSAASAVTDSDDRVVAATVVATEGVVVDLLSRIVSGLPLSEALQVLSRFPQVRAAVMVTEARRLVATGYLEGTVRSVNSNLAIIERRLPVPPDDFLGVDNPELLLSQPSAGLSDEEPAPAQARLEWETTSVDSRGNWSARTQYRILEGSGETSKTPVAKILRLIDY